MPCKLARGSGLIPEGSGVSAFYIVFRVYSISLTHTAHRAHTSGEALYDDMLSKIACCYIVLLHGHSQEALEVQSSC